MSVTPVLGGGDGETALLGLAGRQPGSPARDSGAGHPVSSDHHIHTYVCLCTEVRYWVSVKGILRTFMDGFKARPADFKNAGMGSIPHQV